MPSSMLDKIINILIVGILIYGGIEAFGKMDFQNIVERESNITMQEKGVYFLGFSFAIQTLTPAYKANIRGEDVWIPLFDILDVIPLLIGILLAIAIMKYSGWGFWQSLFAGIFILLLIFVSWKSFNLWLYYYSAAKMGLSTTEARTIYEAVASAYTGLGLAFWGIVGLAGYKLVQVVRK